MAVEAACDPDGHLKTQAKGRAVVEQDEQAAVAHGVTSDHEWSELPRDARAVTDLPASGATQPARRKASPRQKCHAMRSSSMTACTPGADQATPCAAARSSQE